MKRIITFVFTSFLILTLSACGKGKSSYEDLIVGDWAAIEAPSMVENEMTITFNDLKTTYRKDHTSSSTSTLVVSSPMLPKSINLSMAIEASWAINADDLSEAITKADINMTTKIPGMPDMGDMMSQQLIGQGMGKSTILKLDKKNFTVKELESGLTISMQRQ